MSKNSLEMFFLAKVSYKNIQFMSTPYCTMFNVCSVLNVLRHWTISSFFFFWLKKSVGFQIYGPVTVNPIKHVQSSVFSFPFQYIIYIELKPEKIVWNFVSDHWVGAVLSAYTKYQRFCSIRFSNNFFLK